jgi:hypothetical protein
LMLRKRHESERSRLVSSSIWWVDSQVAIVAALPGPLRPRIV